MGYQTKYTLTIGLDDKAARERIIRALLVNSGEASYALNVDGTTSEPCKWYEHEKDMRAFSAARRDILFTLHGEGEESGDIWNKYFLDGLCQVEKARVMIKPFDPKELK